MSSLLLGGHQAGVGNWKEVEVQNNPGKKRCTIKEHHGWVIEGKEKEEHQQAQRGSWSSLYAGVGYVGE